MTDDRIIGHWWFEWIGSWIARGNYATRREAIAAAMEMRKAGVVHECASLDVGQWVHVIGKGDGETLSFRDLNAIEEVRHAKL